MKIIHCADLHLDSRMTANLPPEKAKERKAELLNTFQRMVSYAREQEVAAVIIAGDLFDTKTVSAAAGNVVREAAAANPQMDFYYVKGNHDSDSFSGRLKEMPANWKTFGTEWTSYIPGKAKGRTVVVTGVELNRENVPAIFDSLVLNRDSFNIVVLHGQQTEYGGEENAEYIPLRMLQNKGIDYLALGHIHAYKKDSLDSRGAFCYCGCLEGRGFDECGEHGFVLLDIDEDTKEYTSIFVPFARRNLYALEVDVSGCMTTAQIGARMEEKLQSAGYAQRSLVKVVLTGELDVECEKNIEILFKQFEERYYFFKLYDETKLKVDYRAFLLDESLKGEFVRTVQAESGMEEEERAAVIRYGLQALAGEEMQ